MTRFSKRVLVRSRIMIGLMVGLLASGCADENDERSVQEDVNSLATEVAPSPADRRVFFGDLHVHSSWSFDAFDAGVRVGPEAAYRYALGESIPHVGGVPIQLVGPPLDFMALTEHAEYLGLIAATTELDHVLRALPIVKRWFGEDARASKAAWQKIRRSFGSRIAIPGLVTDSVLAPAWKEIVDLANRYDRGEEFTAFVGYEYTSNPEAQNLHRNILFRGSKVPHRPFSAMDSQLPEDLWGWMDQARARGDDLLAIPHNSNGSNGLMFASQQSDGRPIDRAWAEQRARNEPIVEVMQIKGQSETLPALSPNDEWANFEVTPWRTINPSLASRPRGSYVRDALKTGLLIQDAVGVNPYRLGMIGSTDGHNAASPFEESNYTGKIGTGDATAEKRLAWQPRNRKTGKVRPRVSTYWGGAAGLAGIWADENSRPGLFDALRRREAFSTSGPRIRVRVFGGWSFTEADLNAEIGAEGYARGVPMGGTLTAEPKGAGESEVDSPTFLIVALKDPIEADLERVQVVKGWVDGDQSFERVYDVGCGNGERPDPQSHRCPDRAAMPNFETCEWDAESGAGELRAWWRDPDFDPGQSAFYYVRVLQVPTCRWSTYDANRLGRRLHIGVPAAIQERAITSPIWVEAPSS